MTCFSRGILLVLFVAATLSTPEARASELRKQAQQAVQRARQAMRGCKKLALVEKLGAFARDLADPDLYGYFVEVEQQKDGTWHVHLSRGGQGRWAFFEGTDYLADPRSCSSVALSWRAKASDVAQSMRIRTEGGAGNKQLERLWSLMKIELGAPLDVRHALGRFAVRRWEEAKAANKSKSPWGPSISLYATVFYIEWLAGRPVAQPQTFWPAARGGDGLLISRGAKPALWKRLGRYELWLSDEGERFRRGRQALAIVDRRRSQHAWTLATPLDSGAQGRIHFLGAANDVAYVAVGFPAPGESRWDDLVAIDLARGHSWRVGVGPFQKATLKRRKLSLVKEASKSPLILDLSKKLPEKVPGDW